MFESSPLHGNHQLSLFADKKNIRLFQAIDSVKKQYEEQYVIRASGCANQYEPIAPKLMKAFGFNHKK